VTELDRAWPSDSRPRRLGAGALVLCGFALALVAGVVVWATSGGGSWAFRREVPDLSVGPPPRGGPYIGERSCRECHPGEAALFARSGYSRTLRLVGEGLARRLVGKSFEDPEYLGATWAFSSRDGRLALVRAEGTKAERFPIEYAFGSGHHALTFLTMLDRDWDHPSGLEHRISYYTKEAILAVTPGQPAPARLIGTTPTGRVLPTAKVLQCFSCHTTTTSSVGPKMLDVATMIPNVTCERCHGPGRAHVEAARRGDRDLAMPFGAEGWTTDDLLKLCGECHRHPDRPHPGKITADNPIIARFQPVGLMQSRCFKQSEGALNCVSCHDPHARPSTDLTSYEAVCLGCHQAPGRRDCPVSPRSGCIDRHMPRLDAGQGVKFADHWIRVRQGETAGGP
jgi:predicted CXXCH cytochrome family protein